MRCEIEGNKQNDTTLVIYSYDKSIRERLGFWKDKYTFRLGKFLDDNKSHQHWIQDGNLDVFTKQYLTESLATWIQGLVENLDERRDFHGMKQLITDIFGVDGKYYESLYLTWLDGIWNEKEDAEHLMWCWEANKRYDGRWQHEHHTVGVSS